MHLQREMICQIVGGIWCIAGTTHEASTGDPSSTTAIDCRDDTHGLWLTSSRPLYVGTKDAGVETDAAKHDAMLQSYILHWNDGGSVQDGEWFVCTHGIRCHTMVPSASMACDVGACWSNSDVSVR